jgi:hypothetical protein
LLWQYAAMNGHLEVIQAIVSADPTTLKETNNFRQTPLMVALTQEYLEVRAHRSGSSLTELRPPLPRCVCVIAGRCVPG